MSSMVSQDSLNSVSEDSYLSFTEMEPLDIDQLFVTPFAPAQTKPLNYRFKQPSVDTISTNNIHFYKMMESHSAIFSAFTYLARKGLCYVPKNVLEVLQVKTTKTSILLQQEQKILLFINDRKDTDRRIIVKEILAEPHLSEAWTDRLGKMIK